MKKFFEALSTLALLVVLVLSALLVGVRAIGLTPYCVLSGSMEPEYSVGDLLYVRDIEPEEIEIGMPITFVMNENLLIATHRVIDISVRTTKTEPVMLKNGKAAMDKNGNVITQEIELDEPVRYFLTKGDANDSADIQAVYEKNVIGAPVYSIPYIGFFVTMLKSTAGKIMAGCFGLMLVILMFLPEMLAAIEKSDKKHSNKEETAQESPAEDVLIAGNATGEDVILCEKKTGEDDFKIDSAP